VIFNYHRHFSQLGGKSTLYLVARVGNTPEVLNKFAHSSAMKTQRYRTYCCCVATILASGVSHFTNKNLTLLPRNHRLVGISPTRSSLTRGLTASHPLSIRPREYVCDPSQLRGVVPEDTRGRFQSSFQMPIPS
jgi:hypothetical protein